MAEATVEEWKEENADNWKGQSSALESDSNGSHQQQNLMDSVPAVTVNEGPLARLWENFKTQIKWVPSFYFINLNIFCAERENGSSGQRKVKR